VAAVRPGFRTAFTRAIRAGTPVGAASAPAPLTTPGTNRAASSSTPTKEAAPPAMASASSCWKAAHTMRAVPAADRIPPIASRTLPGRVPSEASGTGRIASSGDTRVARSAGAAEATRVSRRPTPRLIATVDQSIPNVAKR